MKLIDFLREFKYVEPRDEAHYRELMKALQDIQNDPKAYAQVGKLNFMKRKAALDAWADENLPKSEDGVQPTDMKRMGAMGKTLYVHKNGKTIMIPADREKDFIQKGFQRSALRTEDQVDERMPASIIKHKEKLAYMSDKELADRFKDKDDNTLRQMAWRHGYGKMSDYYVNRKNKGMSQDTNEGEMRLDKTAFVQMLADKIKEPQKGHGRPEYDNRLLAKMYELITGKDVDFEGDKFTITMNKPTTEAPDNSDIDIRKLLVDISSMKDRIAELAISDDAKTSAFTALAQVEEDIAQEIKGQFPESVNEGASMIPYFKSEKEFDGEKSTVYEFPMAWAKDKELDTPYLSNASMRQFLTLLGYPADFEEMSAVPIDEFIGVSTQWLKKNIGKPSQEIPTTVDKSGGGATMIGGGKPEGWDNRQVQHHNELARKIKSKYPEVTHLGFN